MDEARQAKRTATDGQTGEPNVPRFAITDVVRFVADVLTAVDLRDEDARRAAETLVVADLRGVDSHGVARLPMYADRLQRGLIAADASLTVLRESAATLALDANNGFGLTLAPDAMARCIAKAEASGLCLTTVRHSNHFGIAGYYALMAAQRGLGGLAMTNASPLVVPTFGAAPMIGTNPLAIAVPTGDGPPLVLDMATSAVAWGKVEVARRAGTAIPLGWAVDATGAATGDPLAARWLTPLGGERATCGHKGYGLAVMVDVLCGPLAGSAWSAHVSGSRGAAQPANIGHTFMAWRIDAFRDPEAFYADLRTMLAELRETPPAPGHADTGVLVPGDPEIAAEAASRRLGVPIQRPVLAELEALAARVRVPFNLVTVS